MKGSGIPNRLEEHHSRSVVYSDSVPVSHAPAYGSEV